MSDRDRKPGTRLPSRPLLILAVASIAIAIGSINTERGSPPETESPFATVLNDEAPLVDPTELVTVRSEMEIERAREQLIAYIFGQTELPDSLATAAPSFLDERDEERFEPFVASIEALIVEMEEGLVSRTIHFVPRKSNGQVVIIHEGHETRFLRQDRAIRKLLVEGYAVIAFFMPLYPPNSQPDFTLPSGRVIPLEWHEQMRFLKPATGHPVRYFIEPVIRVINHVEKQAEYGRISMLGISAGGWTTVLVAAIDPRVAVSVPVAGSYPMYLRELKAADRGDWEQRIPDLYRLRGYLDLYVMGSTGCGRRQVQVFNEYDPCCYAGTAALEYEDAVHNAVRQSGEGSFDVVIESSYRDHAISPLALNTALEALATNSGCP